MLGESGGMLPRKFLKILASLNGSIWYILGFIEPLLDSVKITVMKSHRRPSIFKLPVKLYSAKSTIGKKDNFSTS